MREKKRKIKNTILNLCLILSVFVFFYAGFHLVEIFLEYREGTKTYQKIADDILKPEREEDGQISITVDFEALKKMNSDVVAWIYMEGQPEISYPVVHGTDNVFYLNHLLDKTYNSSGTIFVDEKNTGSFEDPNTIIYGHNMKNDSMFGTLDLYMKGEAYARSPYFWILTPEKNFRYEIFAAHTTSAVGETYTLFQEPSKEFVKWAKAEQQKSAIDTNPEIVWDQNAHIVTLSTCTENDATRNVVQGVLVEE